MTGWKHLDKVITWGEANPDRVFYIGLGMYLAACLMRVA